jgi:hypothetical protein
MSATMDRLAQDNPNVAEQLNAWQISRTRANEDAYDWAAFRQHVQSLGAIDPGDEEPEEFRQYDWTQYAQQS